MYRIKYTDEALKTIEGMDKIIKKRVKKGIEYLARDSKQGKMLTRELRGRWSYRVGDYRIIYRIYHQELIIMVLAIGHRKEIYKTARRKKTIL